MDFQSRMSRDFNDFGTELESFNDQISRTLKIDTYNKEKDFINREIVSNYFSSSIYAGHYSKGPYMYEYLTFLKFDANDVIKNILSDELISPSEKKYLESLYSYNDELIKEYKNIVGNAYKNYDFDKQTKLAKNIVKIYSNYSEKSENLLNTEKYSFMKEYEGDSSFKDINEVDYENAKKYCEEVFSKLFKSTPLQEDNSLKINSDTYTFFKTSPSSTFISVDDESDYSVEFNKKTKEVTIGGGSFSVPDYGHTEQDLNNTAKKIISKFSDNIIRYDKKINYEKDTKISSIEYSYIEEVDGIYDEMKKIEICLERKALISRFKIVYPYDEKIIAPTISKEEILKKIQPGSDITDVLTIRNIEGKTEYEVHLKYKDTIYAAIFDGQKGDLKYYGRETRNYKSQ
ncbi:hypothetical protein [Clostridium sp.]|jgi:hypothetical protein|uniref:hypothetical protein n=1 Tax=Clostridium sp. TaxID=1506 RepID=UPI003EE8CEDF